MLVIGTSAPAASYRRWASRSSSQAPKQTFLAPAACASAVRSGLACIRRSTARTRASSSRMSTGFGR